MVTRCIGSCHAVKSTNAFPAGPPQLPSRHAPGEGVFVGEERGGSKSDQNPTVMAQFGTVLPVVLASATNMWGVLHDRPLTDQDGEFASAQVSKLEKTQCLMKLQWFGL